MKRHKSTDKNVSPRVNYDLVCYSMTLENHMSSPLALLFLFSFQLVTLLSSSLSLSLSLSVLFPPFFLPLPFSPSYTSHISPPSQTLSHLPHLPLQWSWPYSACRWHRSFKSISDYTGQSSGTATERPPCLFVRRSPAFGWYSTTLRSGAGTPVGRILFLSFGASSGGLSHIPSCSIPSLCNGSSLALFPLLVDSYSYSLSPSLLLHFTLGFLSLEELFWYFCLCNSPAFKGLLILQNYQKNEWVIIIFLGMGMGWGWAGWL